MVDYPDAFDALAHVYLEDSWVIDLAPSDQGIAFRLEAVLTPGHQSFNGPVAGEQHCYRLCWLDVRSDEPVEPSFSGAMPA